MRDAAGRMRVAAGALTVLLAGAGFVAAQPGPPAIEVTGATFVEFDGAAGLWRMRGNPVVVTRGAIVLRAPSITYDSRTQVAAASGGATYTDATAAVTAGTITVWLQEERLQADDAVALLVRRSDGRSSAAPTVQVRAGRLELRQRDRRAVGTGGVTLLSEEVTLTGQRLEYDDREQTAEVTGRPVLTWKDATVSADRLQGRFAMDEYVAEGQVHIVLSPSAAADQMEGFAPRAVVRRKDGVAVLSGGAEIRQGQNVARAEVISVQLDSRKVIASGRATVTVYPGR